MCATKSQQSLNISSELLSLGSESVIEPEKKRRREIAVSSQITILIILHKHQCMALYSNNIYTVFK